MTIPLARDRAKVLNAAIVTGEDPARARSGKRGERTLAEVWEWYYEHHAKARKRTYEQDEFFYKTYVGPSLGSKKLSAVTRQEVRRWHAELGKNRSKSVANRALILLSSIFTQALAHDLHRGEHPCRGVEKFPAVARDRRLMPGEIEKFFEAVDTEPSQDIKDYVYLSLFTGQRKGNILAMRWDQIDLDARVWRIPMTKNGRPQLVPLEDAEVKILESRKDNGSEWVFPGRSDGAAGHMIYPTHGWRRILDRAGIKGLTLHDLRRTLASYMVDTGASLAVIGKTLGHQHQSSTQIYARLSLDPVRQAKRAAIKAMKGED
jgi:integrase